MTLPLILNPLVVNKWGDLPDYRAYNNINIGWTGNDDAPRRWNISGANEGAQGAIITGSIKGMVHVPFKGVWHSPAYGPPRFERTVDERREISTRIMTMSDSEYGWFDTESHWWNGMTGDKPGYWDIFTRRRGQMYIPMQLLDAVETELEVDPTSLGNNCQEWDVLLAADGEPRWRVPDFRPPEWVAKFNTPIVQMKRDDSVFAPNINVRVGKLRVYNKGTIPAWPVYVVSAPGRCWLPDGASGRMIRVPQLYEGETCLIDTDPSHRIAISEKDPTPNWLLSILSNIELLQWLGITDADSPTETVLERFNGQGFNEPIAPGAQVTLPILHSQVGARVSVRLPQRFERAIS
jgi:hypothetical protein